MSDELEDWHIKLYEQEEQETQHARMQPFTIKGMTSKQEDAIRDLAEDAGFKNLRGFASWMKSADVTYYDLIKIASP